MKRQTTGIHLWLLLWKASKATEARALQSIQALELGLTDFGVLEALLHKGPLPVNTLGKKMLVTSGSATAAIDRLESRGLVARKLSSEDRRTRLVELTAKGKALIRKSFAKHERDMEQALAFLTSAEKQELAQGLRKLGHGIGNQTNERKSL